MQSFHNQTTPGTVVAVPQPPQVRPRVRARRGQATDPHSIAERVISSLNSKNVDRNEFRLMSSSLVEAVC